MRQSQDLRARDVIEDHPGAEPAARGVRGIVKAVDHREPIALHIGDARRREAAAGIAILDQPRLDRSLLDHIGVIDRVHLGHATGRMALGHIAAQQLILFGRGPGRAFLHHQIGMEARQPPMRSGRAEIRDRDSHSDAGAARLTCRPVGDILAAAEAHTAEYLGGLGSGGGPRNSVNSLRSVRPGRYGQGAGGVR